MIEKITLADGKHSSSSSDLCNFYFGWMMKDI